MEEYGSRKYPEKPARVYFFGTCLIDLFCPQAGLDAVRLLEREGIEVHFPPDQTCCGQPAHSSGFPAQILAHAFEPYVTLDLNVNILRAEGSFAGDLRYVQEKAGPLVAVAGGARLEHRGAARLTRRRLEATRGEHGGERHGDVRAGHLPALGQHFLCDQLHGGCLQLQL